MGAIGYRAQGPMSPALSAFGPASPASSVVSPHRAHFSAASSIHDVGMRRGATDDSGPISPLPWAGGAGSKLETYITTLLIHCAIGTHTACKSPP